jgi:excisionase family DNA binding protein
MDAATGGTAADAHAQPGLMKQAEAAKYLQISQYTLQTWRSRNRERLPFVKVGGQVRYRREDLDRFIEANRSDAS